MTKKGPRNDKKKARNDKKGARNDMKGARNDKTKAVAIRSTLSRVPSIIKEDLSLEVPRLLLPVHKGTEIVEDCLGWGVGLDIYKKSNKVWSYARYFYFPFLTIGFILKVARI